MLDEEIVSFGQRAQHQQDQQQLQLRQHNIPHNPVPPETGHAQNDQMWKRQSGWSNYTSRTVYCSRLCFWNGIRD